MKIHGVAEIRGFWSDFKGGPGGGKISVLDIYDTH